MIKELEKISALMRKKNILQVKILGDGLRILGEIYNHEYFICDYNGMCHDYIYFDKLDIAESWLSDNE